MRNMRVIGRILRSIEGKYEAADVEIDKHDKGADAVAKSGDAGADARAIQSITRATENAATTRRKTKALKPPQSDLEADRAAIKAELDRLTKTVPVKQ